MSGDNIKILSDKEDTRQRELLNILQDFRGKWES